MSENKNDRNENTAGNSDVRKLPPSDPEARDEGPRLIPLASERRHEDIPVANNRRYMDLADQAIRRKPPASQSSPRATRQRKSR
jgi:hypothetical protein